VLAHDGFDCFGGFVGIVEGNGANVMVQNVGFDDTVEQVTTDETKFTIDRCSSTASEGPCFGRIVRE